jgi:hypothetical protein
MNYDIKGEIDAVRLRVDAQDVLLAELDRRALEQGTSSNWRLSPRRANQMLICPEHPFSFREVQSYRLAVKRKKWQQP